YAARRTEARLERISDDGHRAVIRIQDFPSMTGAQSIPGVRITYELWDLETRRNITPWIWTDPDSKDLCFGPHQIKGRSWEPAVFGASELADNAAEQTALRQKLDALETALVHDWVKSGQIKGEMAERNLFRASPYLTADGRQFAHRAPGVLRD